MFTEYERSITHIIRAFAEDRNLSAHAQPFLTALKSSRSNLLLGNPACQKVEDLPLSDVAMWDWTTDVTMLDTEFCSMVNWAVRSDNLALSQDVAVYALAMRTILVRYSGFGLDRRETSLLEPLPAWFSTWQDVTYRGGALPEEHMPFFTVGRKYRSNMFIASSVDDTVALGFRDNATCQVPFKKVMWRFHFPPSGCHHSQFIERYSSCRGELEFLLPPYSCFEIIGCTPVGIDNIIIDVNVFHNNQEVGALIGSESWPLAPWA